MFDPTVTATYDTNEYGYDGEPVSTTTIDDATCEAMKNDPTLNVISCCFTTTIASNRRLSEVDSNPLDRELQNRELQVADAPSSAPSSSFLEQYLTNGFIIVSIPPPAQDQLSAIEAALEDTLGDVSLAIGGNGDVTRVDVLVPSAAPSSEMPSGV